MEGATPQRGGELVRTYGRTSYSPPVPHQRPKKGGRSLHFPPPRTVRRRTKRAGKPHRQGA